MRRLPIMVALLLVGCAPGTASVASVADGAPLGVASSKASNSQISKSLEPSSKPTTEPTTKAAEPANRPSNPAEPKPASESVPEPPAKTSPPAVPESLCPKAPKKSANIKPGPANSFDPKADLEVEYDPNQSIEPKPNSDGPADMEAHGWDRADMSAPIPIISKKHRLSPSYRPRAVGPWGLTPQTNAAIHKLIAAARADGVKMVVRSGYRSYANQKWGYQHALRTYPSSEQAKRFNAPPGASEHQSGLAVDMWDGRNRGYAFRGTPTDKWLDKNAYRFGFIIRYPKGKEHITGYHDEPWHLRYVGNEVANYFGPSNTLTLEEYLAGCNYWRR